MTPFIKRIAVDMKSQMQAGFTLDDIGIVVDTEVGSACGVGRGSAWGEGMAEEAFTALCHEVIAALPFVKADPKLVALSRLAAREFRACERAEQAAFGGDR